MEENDSMTTVSSRKLLQDPTIRSLQNTRRRKNGLPLLFRAAPRLVCSSSSIMSSDSSEGGGDMEDGGWRVQRSDGDGRAT